MWEGGRDSPALPLREQRGLERHQEHQHSLDGAGRKGAMWAESPRGQRVPAQRSQAAGAGWLLPRDPFCCGAAL